MLQSQRRIFLKRSAKLGIATLGSFFSARACHAGWMDEHFAAGQFGDSVIGLFDHRSIIDTNQINLSLPQVAEDGAVVPITISSELENIDRFYILVEKNPTPLAAEFELSDAVTAYITARIKMAESSNVVVVARRGEQLLKTQKWVDVVQGGCGTG